MSLDNTRLLDFLGEIDKELGKKITLIAVGGTAMTLLKAKSSTIDVDFNIPGDGYDEFVRALETTTHGFKVDHYRAGLVFSVVLPDDYVKKSIPIRTKMKNIQLKALSPLDIVVTKTSRLVQRDKEDIEICIRKFKLTKNQILRRAKKIQEAGREENYEINLQHVLKKFF